MTDPEQPSPIVGADAEILTALFSPAGRDDPQAVLRTASVPGCRYAVVNAVLHDRRFAPPALPVRSPDLMFQTLMRWMLRVDGDRHRRLRTRFGGLFTARRVEGFRVMVSNRANELIDAIGDDASFDLVETFANADFRTGGSGQRSGDFVADGASAPPGDGGGGGEVCFAEDG